MCFSFKLFVQHLVLVEIFMSEPVVDWSCSEGQSLSGSLSAEDALAFGVIDGEKSPPSPCHLRRIPLLEGKTHWQSQAMSLLSFYVVGFGGLGIFFPSLWFIPLYALNPSGIKETKPSNSGEYFRHRENAGAQRTWWNHRNPHRDEHLLKEATSFITIYGWSQRKKKGQVPPNPNCPAGPMGSLPRIQDRFS